MIFNGIDNQSVEFKINNYQFPENKIPGDYDSNWLNIYINVKSKIGNWEKIDPSILTSEFKGLIQWFKDLSSNIYRMTDYSFMEPNLEFSCTEKSADSKTIKIIFSAESKAPSMKGVDEECFVDCIYINKELLEIAEELEKELIKFPSR